MMGIHCFCVIRHVSTQQSSPTLSGPALLRLHLAPSDVHVHPIIHHTPNVKLITARGHHLVYTTHKGNTLSVRGVRESALAVDAALQDSLIRSDYWLK